MTKRDAAACLCCARVSDPHPARPEVEGSGEVRDLYRALAPPNGNPGWSVRFFGAKRLGSENPAERDLVDAQSSPQQETERADIVSHLWTKIHAERNGLYAVLQRALSTG